jgi:hypothetical protein
MTPERPHQEPVDASSAGEPREREAVDAYRLCVFASDHFPPSPAEARRVLLQRDLPDADIAVARLQRALREAPAIAIANPWAARPERLHRGLRLYIDHDGADDIVVEIEQIARRLGLAVLDEELDEISFPCPLRAREHIEAAARALCGAGAGYLMIEGGPGDRYFVQAFSEASSRELRLEAVGNRGLGRLWQLSRSHAAELHRRGWRPPRGVELNHSRTLSIASPAAPRRLAALLGDALATAYGLPETAPVTICLSVDRS